MRKLLTENLGLKISALLISVLLWFFVTSRGQSEISLEVPLEFRNIPAGLGIVSSSIKTTTVNIRGQERMMKNIRSSGIRASVDLTKAKKGDDTFFINKDDIKLPHTMSVMTVTPSSVKVRMDETITKVIPVKPVLVGSPEKGYDARVVSVKPSVITVQGLKAEVRKLTELRTEPLDITDLKETISQQVELDTQGANVSFDATAVTVTVTGRKR
ncbi:MAG: YbbR-like domain-containing protein [Nitrospirae bacterium]|nr:MAG: YbbR-like domain-containing protein [Nitrospirota bacterium]